MQNIYCSFFIKEKKQVILSNNPDYFVWQKFYKVKA